MIPGRASEREVLRIPGPFAKGSEGAKRSFSTPSRVTKVREPRFPGAEASPDVRGVTSGFSAPTTAMPAIVSQS